MGSKRYDDYCRKAEMEYLESESAELEFQKAIEEEENTTRTCCGGVEVEDGEHCPICGDK